MKETKWKYLRELYEVSQPTRTSGYFQISASIDNVKVKSLLKSQKAHQAGAYLRFQ